MSENGRIMRLTQRGWDATGDYAVNAEGGNCYNYMHCSTFPKIDTYPLLCQTSRCGSYL